MYYRHICKTGRCATNCPNVVCIIIIIAPSSHYLLQIWTKSLARYIFLKEMLCLLWSRTQSTLFPRFQLRVSLHWRRHSPVRLINACMYHQGPICWILMINFYNPDESHILLYGYVGLKCDNVPGGLSGVGCIFRVYIWIVAFVWSTRHINRLQGKDTVVIIVIASNTGLAL